LAESTLQAKRFSQAVFEIAKQRQDFDKWNNDIQKLAAMARNDEYRSVIENPRFSFEDKKKLLDVQLKNISELARNLAYLLTNQGKFGLVIEIESDFQKLWDEYQGIEKAEVTTAIQLDEKEKAKLTAYLSRITGKKVTLTLKVDPGIIGGIIARVGGKIIDGSTGSQLAALKNELANAGR
jgi:F-type H+-transporting ATPase subunit delta